MRWRPCAAPNLAIRHGSALSRPSPTRALRRPRLSAAEFRPIAERIAANRKAAQAKSVAETGDIKQRLMSMAESIVQVRKVDAPAKPGETVTEDAVPKVQDALDRGAIAEAAKAFAGLPEDVRGQFGEFGTKLASRAAAR